MNADYRNITNKRQWSATIGMTEEEFHHLAERYGESFKRIYGKELWERQEGSTTEARFTTYTDYLFFILFSLKAGVTYDVLGFIFNIDGSSANRMQQEGIRVLRGALKNMKLYPAREFNTVKDFKAWMGKTKKIIIDGQEHAIQRSVNQEVQKKDYSGKKKDTP
jgi:hypothetical protein